MEIFEDRYLKIEKEISENRKKSLFDVWKKGEQNKPLILYGAGGNCEVAMYVCRGYMNFSIACVCDSNAEGVYRYKQEEYNIISPKELLDHYLDAYVLITTWRYEQEIYDFLCGLKFPEEHIYFFRNPHTISTDIFRERYMEGYCWAYAFFPDKRSKQNILNRIQLLLTGGGRPCSPDALYEDGYFSFPGITLQDQEVYVDGGAYTGDTTEQFIKAMKCTFKNYKHIYSFEPDSHNCKMAEKNLKHYSNVNIVPYGLWSSEVVLKFTSDLCTEGMESHLIQNPENENNVSNVSVVSLDNFFAEKSREEWPTIIKMDIEGAEKEALFGAKNIIKERKPRLIISAYHKPQDIYELPQIILKIRGDYQFALWKIGESFWDMVLYAV